MTISACEAKKVLENAHCCMCGQELDFIYEDAVPAEEIWFVSDCCRIRYVLSIKAYASHLDYTITDTRGYE